MLLLAYNALRVKCLSLDSCTCMVSDGRPRMDSRCHALAVCGQVRSQGWWKSGILTTGQVTWLCPDVHYRIHRRRRRTDVLRLTPEMST
jgi:hypothetical protein